MVTVLDSEHSNLIWPKFGGVKFYHWPKALHSMDRRLGTSYKALPHKTY